MNKFKLIALIIIFAAINSNAQETFKEKIKRKLEEARERKLEKTIDNVLNKSEEKIDGKVNKVLTKKEKKEKNASENAANNPDNNGVNQTNDANSNKGTTNSKISATSKFDFIPGEKVLYYDDFSTTAIGDFPLGWNTNSSAELVNITGSNDKWLSFTKDGYFQPMAVTDMPENFTLEFNLFNRHRSTNILNNHFIIGASLNPKRDLGEGNLKNMFRFDWAPCKGSASYYINENGEEMSKNEGLSIKEFTATGENYEFPANTKISIWRQKTRLRIYVNENKVLDIPQAFDPKQKYNVFKLGGQYINYSESENKDEFMVSNIRYAVGAPDTRSKLITEGRLVTRGILFDVNSDKIKPESNGVLKEIATVLQENPTVKVKIIGHTDSDGDAALNLDLSKRRSAAVKNALSTVFGLDASRLETDGKGAAEPSEPNTTPQGKANNRRVEFIKL